MNNIANAFLASDCDVWINIDADIRFRRVDIDQLLSHADKGVPLDEKNARGRTPIDIADVLPIDKAVELLTDLIIKSGAKPKNPSKR